MRVSAGIRWTLMSGQINSSSRVIVYNHRQIKNFKCHFICPLPKFTNSNKYLSKLKIKLIINTWYNVLDTVYGYSSRAFKVTDIKTGALIINRTILCAVWMLIQSSLLV